MKITKLFLSMLLASIALQPAQTQSMQWAHTLNDQPVIVKLALGTVAAATLGIAGCFTAKKLHSHKLHWNWNMLITKNLMS